VWIQTPYFLPSDSLLSSLQAAALAGVDVRVMIPEKCDSSLLTYASRSFVEECLLAGIKVFFFKPGMLHAKVLIADDDFSTIGSTNFDYRSFEHNFEENILLYSIEANRRLAEQFQKDTADSYRVTIADWNTRRRGERIKESLSRLLSPVL
ncbi:MAG: cardiolipin synthase, partial [Duncaniella sp.]|nr:cardiolipin synthase [Duncaniella sp.]